jgi:hypothetical protein
LPAHLALAIFAACHQTERSAAWSASSKSCDWNARHAAGKVGNHVARLLEELGPGARLTDWLHARTADCPPKNQAGVTRACGAVMPDLVDLP